MIVSLRSACGVLRMENCHLRKMLRQTQLREGFEAVMGGTDTKSKLYLKYVENVLQEKERELVEAESEFMEEKRRFEEETLNSKLLRPLGFSLDLDLIVNVIQDAKELLQHPSIKDNHEFLRSLSEKQSECLQLRDQSEQTVRAEFDKLCEERQTVATKFQKLTELQCYEEYLNNLHKLLEKKEKSIKREELHISPTKNSSQYLSQQKSLSSQPRKRMKIFQEGNPKQESFLGFMQAASGDQGIHEEDMHCDFDQFGGSLNNHKESSQIMQQKSEISVYRPILCSATTQTALGVSYSQTEKLESKAFSLKDLDQWLKPSPEFDQKQQEVIGWLLLRLKVGQSSKNQGLALKKEKVLDTCLDLQKKQFKHELRFVALKSILRNKIRKEKMSFVLMFRKMAANCFQNIRKDTQRSFPLTSNSRINTKANGHPSRASSLILKENSVIETLKGQSRVRGGRSGVSESSKGKTQIDVSRLHEYILEQEGTERKLTQVCLQTEAVLRLQRSVQRIEGRTRTFAMLRLLRSGSAIRVEAMEKQLSCLQFKWEFFVTKVRFALRSNTSKISQLQQLLSLATDR